jgi:hypothetical protein
MLIYRIADPGEGFDIERLRHAAISNPEHDPIHHLVVREEKGLRPGGFGLAMTRSFVDELIYNEARNEVLSSVSPIATTFRSPVLQTRYLTATAEAMAHPPLELFVSYSHRDEALRDELARHLAVLERQHVIAGWHDRRIGAGKDWQGAIDERLNRAQIILLLISADF